MALSPNYGFPEPDNASLVKNGAQDIRALGDAIDSFLFRPFGLNPVINSAFQVWQRGTSIAVASGAFTYTSDRWQTFRTGGGQTISRQTTADTTNLPFIQYCARVQRNSGNSAVNRIDFNQSFESINSIPYAGKTVTFSFYARKGADFSAASSQISGSLIGGTGTDQNVTSGFTGATFIASGNATLTTTWQRFSFTGNAGSTITQLGIDFRFTPVGTAGANDYYEVTGVQVDVGSVALPFRTNGETFQGELAACQRYYWRNTNTATSDTWLTAALGGSTTTAYFAMQYPVTMRTIPSALDYSGFRLTSATAGFTGGTVAIVTNSASPSNVGLIYTHGSATLTQGALYYSQVSANGYLGFSAEL